jgi:hypothetical protein
MDLLALADFNLVARHGGFGRAARAAGRPKATLSRRVAELESGLGLRLFERGARTPKLTEEGRALYEPDGGPCSLSSHCRRKAAAVSRADHPRVSGPQDVGSSIAAGIHPTSPCPSNPSGTVGDATARRSAAYPPISRRPG